MESRSRETNREASISLNTQHPTPNTPTMDNDDRGYGSIFVGTKVATGEAVVLKVVNVHSCAFRRFRYLTQETVEELRRYIIR